MIKFLGRGSGPFIGRPGTQRLKLRLRLPRLKATLRAGVRPAVIVVHGLFLLRNLDYRRHRGRTTSVGFARDILGVPRRASRSSKTSLRVGLKDHLLLILF